MIAERPYRDNLSRASSGATAVTLVASAAPAEAEGLVVAFALAGSGRLTAPATVAIPAGASSATFSVTGVAEGAVTLTVAAPQRLPATAQLTVTPELAIAVTNSLGTAVSATPFTVKPQQDFALALEPAALQAPLGGFASARVAIVSQGLSPYRFGVALSVTGCRRG